jgi:hypothetical protein
LLAPELKVGAVEAGHLTDAGHVTVYPDPAESCTNFNVNAYALLLTVLANEYVTLFARTCKKF